MFVCIHSFMLYLFVCWIQVIARDDRKARENLRNFIKGVETRFSKVTARKRAEHKIHRMIRQEVDACPELTKVCLDVFTSPYRV